MERDESEHQEIIVQECQQDLAVCPRVIWAPRCSAGSQ